MRALFCGNQDQIPKVKLWMRVKHLTFPGITWMI